MESRVNCSFCDKTYAHKKHLYVHIRKIHEQDPLLTKNILCEICNKRFVTKKSLHAHKLKFHQDDSITRKTNQCRIICPYENCEEVLITLKNQKKHLFEKHRIHIESEEITLNGMTEFQKWKCEIEQKSVSQYVLDRKSSILMDGSKKNMYYCHRSHNYIKKGKDIRYIKSMGSNKIGKVCSSLIETIENNGTISVKYWKTHCGHGIEELGRMKLDEETRIQIAAKLKERVTFDHILDSIRDAASSKSIQRTLLLDRQDLKNISRDFNINYKQSCKVFE